MYRSGATKPPPGKPRIPGPVVVVVEPVQVLDQALERMLVAVDLVVDSFTTTRNVRIYLRDFRPRSDGMLESTPPRCGPVNAVLASNNMLDIIPTSVSCLCLSNVPFAGRMLDTPDKQCRKRICSADDDQQTNTCTKHAPHRFIYKIIILFLSLFPCYGKADGNRNL